MSDREKYDRGREKLGRIWLIPGKKIPAHVRPQKVRPHLRDREKGVYRLADLLKFSFCKMFTFSMDVLKAAEIGRNPPSSLGVAVGWTSLRPLDVPPDVPLGARPPWAWLLAELIRRRPIASN